MERKAQPAFLASSTKSFQLSGLSRGSHITLCTSSVTYPWNRLMPWPRMNATISSLRLERSSDMEVSRGCGAALGRSPAKVHHTPMRAGRGNELGAEKDRADAPAAECFVAG